MYRHEFKKMTYSDMAHTIMVEYATYSGGSSLAGFGTVDRAKTTHREFTKGILGKLSEKDARLIDDIGLVDRNVGVWLTSFPLYNKEDIIIYQQLNNPRKIDTGAVAGSVITVSHPMTAGIYKGLYVWQGTNLFLITDNTTTTITVTGSPIDGSFLVSGYVKWYPIFGNIAPQVGDIQPFTQIICSNVPMVGK